MARGGFGGWGWDGDRRDRRKRSVPARAIVPRALSYLRPYWWPTLVILACLIAAAALGVIPPLITRDIIDVALPQGNTGLLNVLILAMAAVPIISGLIGVLQNYLNTLVSQRIMLDMRNELYRHLQGLSLRFTGNKTGGSCRLYRRRRHRPSTGSSSPSRLTSSRSPSRSSSLP
jgi:ATP-binding cassette subfamily B protein